MARVAPYHTNAAEYSPRTRQVYHDHDDCPDGRRIKRLLREKGTGAKPRCGDCKRLDQ